ncbi:MAG: SGNH/GDSL hydrolase family protein [Clostridia bacterium]|nr:SGNH/GDSL hydrolase family protein [Clostridia bacterium]
MKKRILAFALTLTMVITSLSMLSFVSFAEDTSAESSFEATDGDLYAWLYSLNVDGNVDRADPLMCSNILLRENLNTAVCWDYDNVYIYMYYVGAKKESSHLKDVTWTVGGATATVTGGGATTGGTYTKIKASIYACEIAIPLTAINAKLENGVLSADMTLDLVIDDAGTRITKNYNLIFSGRSLITRLWETNPQDTTSQTNGYLGFNVRAEARGGNAVATTLKTGSTAAAEGFAGVTGGAYNHDKINLWDRQAYGAQPTTANVCIVATMGNIVQWTKSTLDANANGGNHYEAVVKIGNLKAQNVTVNAETNIATNINRDSVSFGSEDISMLQFQSGGRDMGYGTPQGARASVYQDKATGHLMLALAVTETTSVVCDITEKCGVEEGDTFLIGFDEKSNGKTIAYVNNEKVLEGNIVNAVWQGAGGMVIVVKETGNLDADGDGAVTSDEYIDVTLTKFSMSKVNNVDVATAGTKFKSVNGVAAPAAPTVLTAKPGVGVNINNYDKYSGTPVSIGSASKAWATYDIEAQKLYLTLDNRNVDNFKINVGGAEATVTFTKKTDDIFIQNNPEKTSRTGIHVLIANCASDDGITAATHPVYNGVSGVASDNSVRGWHRTVVSIPLSAIDIERISHTGFVADISIDATYTYAIPKNATAYHTRGSYVGSFDGTLSFELGIGNKLNVGVRDTYSHWTQTTESNVAQNGGIYTWTDTNKDGVNDAPMNPFANPEYAAWTTYDASAKGVSFDMKVSALGTVSYAAIDSHLNNWSWAATAQPAVQRIYMILFSSSGANKGAIIMQIFNTPDGLVLAYKNTNGTCTKVILEKTLGETFTVDVLLDDSLYGYISVDGEKVVERDNILSQVGSNPITGAANRGGLYTMHYVGSLTSPANYDVSMTNYSVWTAASPVFSSDIEGVIDADGNGSIKLSYVQETVAKFGDFVPGNGLITGAYADGTLKTTGKDSIDIHFQANAAYNVVANRKILLDMTLNHLDDYDFSNGDTLSGDEKYTANVDAVYYDHDDKGTPGYNRSPAMGVAPNDQAGEAFDKVLIAYASKMDEADTMRGLFSFWLVNDANDGLVLIHTNRDGKETVAKLNIKGVDNTRLEFIIVWTKNNSASVMVNGKHVMSLGDVLTVYAPKGEQIYYGNGIFQGLKLIGGSANDHANTPSSITVNNTGVVTSNDPFDVRFTATIDTIKAKEAGFEISLKGSDKPAETYSTTTVYKAIKANENGDIKTITAKDGEYFVALGVKNVPAIGTFEFIVKPYYVDNTDYTCTGDVYCITYTDGIYMGYEKYKEPTGFEGKAVVTFGDSITWYNGNTYNWGKEAGSKATGYQHYMEEELGLTVYNQGYSGNTMPQIMGYARAYTNFKNVDYMTIMSGGNDERRNTPLGTLAAKGSNFDTTTYIGALQSGIEYALACNPEIKIVLFTPIVGWIYADGQGDEGYDYDYDEANQPTVDGIITEKWANAVKEVAELYGLTVCDLYNDCEMQYDIQDRIDYMNDPEPENGNNLYSLHPNTAGYKLMAKEIIKTFKSLKSK